MNTASLENSKRLYELSGWRGTSFLFTSKAGGELWIPSYHTYIVDVKSKIPAYDLGFMLRKLPAKRGEMYLGVIQDEWEDKTEPWQAGYFDNLEGNSEVEAADTPEDAVALLAIKLFEEGILKK